ncbi:MAG: tetratricopeptide repeat protein [Ignavibacteriae bacterium]|nr:tetratricopeptide repeat protein [Ignavibacteriota bacterium]
MTPNVRRNEYDVHDFETEVIKRSFDIPVLVDFWAEWCAPCRILSPILERLAEQNKDKWVLAKVNTEEHQDVAVQYGVQGIPNVKLFFEGKIIGEFVGALPEYVVVQWLRENVPSRHRTKIELAKTLIADQRLSDAQQLLENILTVEVENQEVKVLLARVHLFTDPTKAADLLRDVDDPRHAELSEALRTLTRLFDLHNRLDELPEGLSKQTYLNAIADIRAQKFDAALEKLIEIIRTDRYYDDDGSRKACIAIFKLLGEEHPTTQKYRRDFSSALYV